MKDLEELTFWQLLRRTASRFSAREAVRFAGESITYEELIERVSRCGAALCARGIGRGDHVAIRSDNTPEALIAFYAVMSMGAVAVMLNTSLTGAETCAMTAFSDSTCLILGPVRRRREGQEAAFPRESLPALKQVLLLPGAEERCGEPFPTRTSAEDRERFESLCAAVRPEDTAAMLFTSGSSGLSKAVLTSHYSRVNSGIQQGADLAASEEDRWCAVLPMFHCFSISANLLACLSVGGCLCFPDTRRTADIVKTIRQERCTVFNGVPTLYLAILSKPDFDPADFASVRTGIIGGAGYTPEEFCRIEKELGMTLLSSLGQTETTAGSTICRAGEPLERRANTVGEFMDHVEGRIADLKTGRTLPAGEIGEICVRGYLVMQRYYRQPGATRKAIDAEGWFHTGDLGSLDEEGYLTMHGRSKELIIRGGENISPLEVEMAIERLPQVKQCKVIGVPSRIFGEEVCACVVLLPGESLTAEELRRALSDRLAYYKLPKYVLFWASLPTTDTGKTDLPALRERVGRELGEEA